MPKIKMTVRGIEKRTPAPISGQIDYWDESLPAFGLTQKQIDQAYGNEDTKLPAGLAMPANWPM